MATGTATLDFGAFPGKSDASLAITGQTAIVSGSIVEAWLRPADTADHTADEHMVETLKVFAASIVAGTGFTIYGFNTGQLYQREPENEALTTSSATRPQGWGPGGLGRETPAAAEDPNKTNRGTLIYGQWSVAWAWV